MANTTNPPHMDDDVNHPDSKEASQSFSPSQDSEGSQGENTEKKQQQGNDVQNQLEKLEAEIEEYKSQALRAMADMENIRRRAQDDVIKASKFAIENFAEQLLGVKDSLEMALADPNGDITILRQGVELTLKQLTQAFERAKIAEVASEGQPFDPNIHQAVSTIAHNAPANTVVQVYQKGYRLNDRVLRPAMVVVSQG